MRQILPRHAGVASVVLKLLGNYSSFASIMAKYMTTEIANNIANSNGIDILMKLYSNTERQVYLILIQHVLAFFTTSRFIDVNSLFRLSQLSPALQDQSLKKLDEISKN